MYCWLNVQIRWTLVVWASNDYELLKEHMMPEMTALYRNMVHKMMNNIFEIYIVLTTALVIR